MRLVKYVFLLPLSSNDGRRVSGRVLDGYLAELFELASGFTVAGTVSGAYRMHSGLKQVDRSLEVWVVLERSRERRLKSWLSKIAAALGQESMYLERTGGVISFVRASRNAGAEDESKIKRDT